MQRLNIRYLTAFGFVVSNSLSLSATTPNVMPKVVVEEEVYTLVSPNNGAGPMWSYGCTTIVREGQRVFASQMETSPNVPIPCNTRWRLLERQEGTWNTFAEAKSFQQREPCPLGVLSGGQLVLSVNDGLQAPGPSSMPCEPHLLRFDIEKRGAEPIKLNANWDISKPNFTEHSYRGLAFDRDANRILQMNIDASTSAQHWALLDQQGSTIKNGQIEFPIRACYPQVALNGNSSHVMAISDIVEPIEAWRNYKFEQTKRKWDYVFRVLYYTWSPDLTSQTFAKPIEIDNVESTGGHITNYDLWIGPDGSAYLLYGKQQVAGELLRDKFFSNLSTKTTLELAIVKDGTIRERHTLMGHSDSRFPGVARFHETTDHRLYAVVHSYHGEESNSLLPIYPELNTENSINIPLKHPFRSFFVASVRAGNLPANTIDLIGHQQSQDVISYAQIELESPK